MINQIIHFSIKHKFVVLLLLLAIVGGGVYSLRTINIDSTPDITNNQVQVITVSENLSTADIEQYVTYPVELAMANLPGVEDLRSVSRFGLSVVTVVFSDDMGTYLPRQLVQEKLDEVREQIPEGFGSPEMGPITTGLGEIFQYTLVPKDTARYTPQELRTIQDWIVRRQMAMIPGVVEVNSFGGSIKQYEISIDPDRLNAMGVTLGELMDALKANNVNTGGAYIEKNHMAHFIRGEGLVKSTDDIRQIVVKQNGGMPVLVGDVASNVTLGEQVRYGAFTQDGREAVGGMILMLKGANSDKVVTDVKRRIAEVQKSLPADIEIRPFLDRSNLISRTTGTISRNLIEGALIVVFVLVLLLGSLRGGIITASVIPLSLLFAFILMRIFGVWANLMSLGAIDFGIIVDGAVIIVEGIVLEVEHRLKTATSAISRADMDDICRHSASTMMHSAFFGQLIILIVFTPILFLTGVSGKMFQPMAFTFAFAVLGAIILCLTYVPVASALLMKPLANKQSRVARFERALERLSEAIMGKITKAYTPALQLALRHKAVVLSAAVALLALTGFTFAQMGGEFIPSLDEGDIAMQTFLRPGSSLSETIKREKEVERLIKANFPEVKTMCARIGVADIPTDPMGFDYTDSFIILEKDMSKWTSASSKEELIEKMEEKLKAELPGLNFSFSQPVELRFNELLTGVREDVAVTLYGEDLDTLSMLGEKMVNTISRIPGAEDVALERTDGLPQITVKYDRSRLARYGLQIDKLNSYVSAAFAGGKAGVVFEGEKRFDMVVRLDKEHRQSIDDLRNLLIDTPDGQQIALGEVAEVDYQPGPMQISRVHASRCIYVGVNVRGRDVQSVVSDIKRSIGSKITLPAGYHVEYGGEFQNLEEARSRLMVVLPVALLLIFVLLYFALQSLAQSVMIFMAVPLATIGGVFSLWLRGMPFSISAGVGFIVLFGVAVLNGLVLINRFNSLKSEGMTDMLNIILTGTRERIRPILLTATAAMLGFLPMAVSHSAGAEVQRPLATVVIGGLFSATLLTLFVLPLLYALEERLRRPKKKAAATTAALLIFASLSTGAQTPVSLQKAQDLAVAYYPSLKAAHLEVQAAATARTTKWDLGDTEFSAGGEEVGCGNEAVWNLLTVRQNLDLTGASALRAYNGQREQVGRAAVDLAEADLRREVSIDYATAYVAAKRVAVYERLDSLCHEFERAAKVRFDAQATSRLEYISAQNQSSQACLKLDEARIDYQIALQNLNRWLGTDVAYAPEAALPIVCHASDEALATHPSERLAQEKIKLAQAAVELEKSQYRPKFFVEYGSQMIGSKLGYHAFSLGVSVPLFSSKSGKVKEAQISREMAVQELEQQRLEASATRRALISEEKKWDQSVAYYRQTALPVAAEQREAAMLAYRQGASSYVEFVQNLKESTQVQLDYWDAMAQYLSAHFRLEYYVGQQ